MRFLRGVLSNRGAFILWIGVVFGVGLVYTIWRYVSPPSYVLGLLGGAIAVYHFSIACLVSRRLKKAKKSREQLYEQSMQDALTGLKNMRYLRKHIQQLLACNRKHDEHFGIIFFDLDNFKTQNDQLGHLAGDEILKQVAKFFFDHTREEEIIVRYGGDEFILLVPKSSKEKLMQVAKRLRSEFANTPVVVQGKKIFLQTSGGAARYPEDGDTIEELLDVADKNLYRAKKVGNRVCFSWEMSSEAKEFIEPVAMGHKERYLDVVTKKSTHIYLLAQMGDLEVIKQAIEKNRIFRISGEATPKSFEFIYVLEGEIHYKKEDRFFKPGSFILTQSFNGEIYFKARTKTVLLYVNNIPIFKAKQRQIQRLMALGKEVAQKDQRTEAHCDRLQELVMRTGEEMGIKEQHLFKLVYASVLHDIGKIHVPPSILLKKGKLSEEQWKQMKKHSVWGRDLILQRLQFEEFKEVADIVYQHHERFDGGGYPQGLKGEEIRLEAQVLSIADAYDAMISDRPYRLAMTRNVAREELKTESGRQFAPRVVEAFLRVEERIWKGHE